jgi:hypothetical protein
MHKVYHGERSNASKAMHHSMQEQREGEESCVRPRHLCFIRVSNRPHAQQFCFKEGALGNNWMDLRTEIDVVTKGAV